MKQAINFCIAIVLVLGTMVTPSAAQQQRTDQLLWDCEGRGEMGQLGILHCTSYLSAMNDLNALLPAIYGKQIFRAPETGVSNDQLRLIFIKWARDHPEDLHATARVTALVALHEAFPCTD